MRTTRLQTLTTAAIVALIVGVSGECRAQWSVDVETGTAIGGYNDVRIPGTTGTDLSLTEDLTSDPAVFVRVRIARRFGERNTLSMLIAPLRLEAEGSVARPIEFANATFPADAPLRSLYRFDSYRLTYTYDVLRRTGFQLRAGLTAKIRDAEIRLTSDDIEAKKTNTGFVPLLHCAGEWDFSTRIRLLFEVDALAAPQGRAEDIQVALAGRLGDALRLRLGYRLLEGGADNDEVYTFALVHYVLIGLEWRL